MLPVKMNLQITVDDFFDVSLSSVGAEFFGSSCALKNKVPR